MPQPKSSSGTTRKTTAARKPAAAKSGSAAKSAAASKPAAASRSAASSKPAAKKPAASKPAARGSAGANGSAAKTTAASRSAASSKPAAKKPAARKPAAARTTAAASTTRKTTAAKTTAASKPAAKGTTSSRSTAKAKTTGTTRKAPAAAAPRSAAARDDQLRQNLAQLRDVLAQAVVIPADRVQAVLDDARKRGHIDAKGVQDIAGGLIEAGRRQADELRTELESIVGRGRAGGDDLVAKVTGPARRATKAATAAGDPVLKQVDKVVRRTGLASFPITGYDDLKVDQIKDRLGDLGKPDLRKVRTYETKHANRKSVLTAIEKQLSA